MTDSDARWEISDLLTELAVYLDNRDWERWRVLFTPGASLDFSAVGMGIYSPDEFAGHISSSDRYRVGGLHLLGSRIIRFTNSDAATVRVEYTMTSLSSGPSVDEQRCVRLGGWYDDDVAYADDRWRVSFQRASVRWTIREILPAKQDS
jgi:hypothetical protein